MRTATLRGRDHTELGAVATVAEGRAAVALSRGGAPKRYPHDDPNEDVAAFARGAGGCLVAVADGHRGCAGAEIAMETLLAEAAASLVAEDAQALLRDFPAAAARILADAHDAIGARAGRPGPRTTFAFALVRPAEDLLAWALVGDSHVFRVGPGGAVELGLDEAARSGFLGSMADDAESLGERCAAGTLPLGDTRAVVLATDGLSEQGIGVDTPAREVARAVAEAEREAPELRAQGAARGVVEAALAAQRRQRSGDNVASAVVWVAD